jgi:4-amino-4-deoxy-L-arabinose transferase-like glycosyltransferase
VRRPRVVTYLFFFAAFASIVCLTHVRYLRLPYYWDELGQFVPAALDIYEKGAWIPQRTIPNVHPPGLMACLAAVWTVTGHSIPATRLAMLALGSASLLVLFLLAIELTKGVRGAPAFAAVLLMAASPLFYTQSMLAQLDLPAMLFSSWALLLFLQNRWRGAAIVCVAAVLVKETAVVVPAVFALWLWFEGRRKDALWFLAAPLALAAWIFFLWRGTGHLFGNHEFTAFNLAFPLHPARLGAAMVRRIWYLGIEHLHFLGWIFVYLAWRKRLFANRAWRVAGAVALAHVLVVTIFGGAVLERYLLPALAILYIAFAAAMPRPALFVLAAALVAGLFWNVPYPYPFENNLAMVDFVRLQETAAEWVERVHPNETITTAWPLTAALWLPELGYVHERRSIQRVPDFDPAELRKLSDVSVFVLFSKDWQRPFDLRRFGPIARIYGWHPQVTGDEVARRFGLTREAYWQRGGQWVAVYAKIEVR